jgi:predicted nuclease of predicted toxin-antitoxin system
MPYLGLRLLADENIEHEIVKRLRGLGHDVTWLVTEKPGLLDEYIPGIMAQDQRILLTYDVDFVSALRLSGQSHTGAVLIRAIHLDFEWKVSTLEKTLRGHPSWLGRIAVIKPNGIRYSPA